MRPRDGAEVGAAGRDDAVRVVGLVDRADGDGRDAGLVADAIGERRLVHAPVDRLARAATTWPDEQSIMSAPAALNSRAIATASSGVMPPSTQSCAEMRTLIGLSAGQTARMAANTSSG